MEITEVRVFPVQEEKLKAFVSIVLDRCFMVNDIKVIQGKDSLFISMPSRKKRNGEFKDVAHPLNNETRRWVEDRILAEYRAVLDGSGSAAEAPRREPAEAAAEAGEARAVPEAVKRRKLRRSKRSSGGISTIPSGESARTDRRILGGGTLGRRQAVRHETLDLAFGGSNPPAPTMPPRRRRRTRAGGCGDTRDEGDAGDARRDQDLLADARILR